MFERLAERARRMGEARAKARAGELARAAGEAAPPGVIAEELEGGFCLSERGLWRRYTLEPAIRWLVGRVR
jgi:hypothetical protein